MLFVERGDAANDGTFFILHPLVKSYVQMEMERKNGQGLQVQLFEANDFGECTYLLFREGGSGILIDAGFLYDEEWRHFTDFIAEHNVTLTLLLNTHGHIDHVAGVAKAVSKWNLPFAMHPADTHLLNHAPMFGGAFAKLGAIPAPTKPLEDGQKIDFEGTEIEVIHTPGHTKGGCSFYLPASRVLFSGDTLFEGSIGRTDLGDGDYDQIISSIRTKLFTLPDDTIVLPGHGGRTTIGREKQFNPFFR